MKILFCGRAFPEARERLQKLLPNENIVFSPVEELSEHVSDADIIVPVGTKIDERLIEQGKFGLIQQFGVGLETVDIEAATRNGVLVARIPSEESGNAASVAEHALLLMLMLSRRLKEASRSFEAGRVGTPMGQALLGKTACIIGLGGVGRALAKRLKGFDLSIIAVDDNPKHVVPGLAIDRLFPIAQLADAVSRADYVVLCINYTSERFHLVGEKELAKMKPGAFLVNVARGGLLDQNALLKVLISGQIAGAGLDVFWEEPVDPNHPLFSQNVIATPHIAGVTDASYDGIANAFADNIRRYAQGERPLYLANPLVVPGRHREPHVSSI